MTSADPAANTGTFTAESCVDQALLRLGDLPSSALSEHVGVFEDVHRILQNCLADAEGE